MVLEELAANSADLVQVDHLDIHLEDQVEADQVVPFLEDLGHQGVQLFREMLEVLDIHQEDLVVLDQVVHLGLELEDLEYQVSLVVQGVLEATLLEVQVQAGQVAQVH